MSDLKSNQMSGAIRQDAASIEALLNAHPNVEASCVSGSSPVSDDGQVCIFAFVVLKDMHAGTTVDELKALFVQLPTDAKRPAFVNVVERFPLDAKGEIDREALAEIVKRDIILASNIDNVLMKYKTFNQS